MLGSRAYVSSPALPCFRAVQMWLPFCSLRLNASAHERGSGFELWQRPAIEAASFTGFSASGPRLTALRAAKGNFLDYEAVKHPAN